jgi:UDP-N-acetylmuramate dehydrogenase
VNPEKAHQASVEEAKRLLGSLAQTNINLGTMTTYRVGGNAALYVEAQSEDELSQIAVTQQATGLPVLIVGKGSNLLVAEAGFPGIAVSLGEQFEASEIDAERAVVRAGGPVALPALARRCVHAGLTGFEWAVGVPGSIGGAIRMNAGGHGSDMKACVTRATIFDFANSSTELWDKPRLRFAYRKSSISPTQIVLEATLQLTHDLAGRAQNMLGEIVQWRRDNQPGGQNAGSVFVNPETETAGELLDRLGFKGFRIGSAQISPKHANFVQVDQGGSSDDVDAVIRAVAARVFNEAGIELRTEIRRVGFEE